MKSNSTPKLFKKCQLCGKEKEKTEEYFPVQSKKKDGLMNWCRDCARNQEKKRYEAKKTMRIEQVKKWQANPKNKPSIQKSQAKYRQKQKTIKDSNPQ